MDKAEDSSNISVKQTIPPHSNTYSKEDTNEITKKELLALTKISYGQLYRWKREGLIPEEWFIKRASYTGQETYFARARILERVAAIQSMKDNHSLNDIRVALDSSTTTLNLYEALLATTDISESFLEKMGTLTKDKMSLLGILPKSFPETQRSSSIDTSVVTGSVAIPITSPINQTFAVKPEKTQKNSLAALDISQLCLNPETIAVLAVIYKTSHESLHKECKEKSGGETIVSENECLRLMSDALASLAFRVTAPTYVVVYRTLISGAKAQGAAVGADGMAMSATALELKDGVDKSVDKSADKKKLNIAQKSVQKSTEKSVEMSADKSTLHFMVCDGSERPVFDSNVCIVACEFVADIAERICLRMATGKTN